MIGQTVYIFDITRRVNRDGFRGGPIWREHYRPEVVESETSRSWVTKYGTKVPKKGRDPHSIAISMQEIEELEWVHEHRYKIVRLLEQCHEPETIKQIAALLRFDAANGESKEGK